MDADQKLDKTLGQFLLEKFPGALLPTPEPTPAKEGTLGAMVDPLDDELCECVRFHPKENVSLETMCEVLREYWDSIHWSHDIYLSDPGELGVVIMGDVWPDQAETALAVIGLFERNKDNRELLTGAIIIATNPIIC